MNQKFFYKLALHLGALPDSINFIVKRDDFVEFMKLQGYAERTINNHAAPSRKGGIINQLMDDELIIDGGVKRWCIPSVQKLNAQNLKKEKKATIVKLFAGNPPDGEGWITSTRLDDDEEEGLEWRLYRKEYAPKCNNLKVVAIGKRVPHKANYWMQCKNGKLLMTKNAILLKQHRKDIFNNLCEDLEDLD
tara:strand:- start:1354 stop:1926 length:573 start_codon:yes stop_codon:yes gene_type:complete